jgi:predicted DNA-binding transcriptional regulator AlpA
MSAHQPLRHLHQNEVAHRWGISPRTLERWRWLGQGPTFLKLGGSVVYRLEDIEAFEAQQLRAARAALGHPELTGEERFARGMPR